MSVPTPVPDETAPRHAGSGQPVLAALAGLAVAAQVFVLLATLLMGLGWGGLTHVVALVQAGAAFLLISWLATRRLAAVVLVPVASAALTVGLAVAGQAHGRATACSDQERAAAQQLAPPPGTSVAFEGEYTEGCVARTRMRLSNQAIVEHYEAEFTRLGWQQTDQGLDTTIGTAAVKDGLQLVVGIEEPTGSRTFEVVVGDRSTADPCAFDLVGGYEPLTREPTAGVEPGHWMVLASASDLPASVTVHDRAGTLVLEQQAHPRPVTGDDLMALETPTLSLDEGDYTVRCRPDEGAVTVVPLHVGWAAPPAVEQGKSVVLRLFETPTGG